MADASVAAPNAAEGDQQSPGSDFNYAALMMGISAILEGRDLHSFCMKDMWGALEEQLGISSAELQDRKSEILDLVQAEVQRIMDQENKPSSKNAKSISKKRKNAENVDWRYMLERRERKMGKAAAKMGQASEPDSRPDIEQMPENPEELQQFNITTPLNVTIEDNAIQLSPRTFPSGTRGFHALQKLTVTLDGKPRSLICQVSCAIVPGKSD
ncbi:KRE33 [Symbiodinium sp. CCMP2592]|nr:KRE33 [Symbiodinium sp. CCMP2592]